MLGVEMILFMDYPDKAKHMKLLMESEPDILINCTTFVERYDKWYKNMHYFLEDIRLTYYKEGKIKDNERLIEAIEVLNQKNDFINDYVKSNFTQKM